ncbi:MAG: class I SAM-dependent methyltransferase [Epulopiscium sp.]|nr:class I SAM-dependent methyltransferase [Candidatus Epulonipiscium sp.]
MGTYGHFARVYDRFMEEVPYEEWGNYIERLFLQNQLQPKIIAELGCGTGNMTEIMSQKGYEMIGIDLSEDMLMIAKEKALQKKMDILYLAQDIRDFELYGTVDCFISICDTMNYLLEEEELKQVFQLVNTYLNPGGFFIFDMNTEYKYHQTLASNTFTDVQEQTAYIWENNYDLESQINEYIVNFFVQDEEGTSYTRFEEVHYQRAYQIETITKLLSDAGLEVVEVYDAFTFQPPAIDSERIYFIAKETRKKGGNNQ